ncbi:ABC transporter substrate-binding protein [Mesorhizobium sp. WSM3876]|nr:ABC transporter substrate-binding protein [Mesorhizobium sp. WSM3876]
MGEWGGLGALLAVALASSGVRAQADEPIKIGFAIAQSGWMANYDVGPFQAAVLKIEEINKAGGLLGRQIQYSVIDTKTDQTLAGTAGSQLLDWGADMLVVPTDYDYGAAAALAAQNAGKIAISPGAGDPKMGVQGVGPYVFTAHTAAQTQGIVMAEYAKKVMGLKTAYALEDVSIEYSKSGCAGYKAGWQNVGGTLVGSDTFKNDEPSIAAQITRLKSASPAPDVIFLCSYTPGGGSAVRQIRAAGIDTPIVSLTGMTDNYWLGAVPGLKDFYIPAIMSLYGDDPRPEIGKFLAAYKARWKEEPTSSFAVLGYSTIEQWAYAVEKAKTTDSQAVLAVMNQYKDQPFTVGLTSYTDQLHIQINRPQLIMKVENGSFHAVEMYRNEFMPDMKLLFRSGQ